MPTKRPRLTITETPEVRRRLDRAALAFPELAGERRELLLRLTEEGEKALRERGEGDPRGAAKQRILARTSAISPADADRMLASRDEAWQHGIY